MHAAFKVKCRVVATFWIAALGLGASGSPAQEVDEAVIAEIKMEGFQNSQLMETAFHLSEALGPRLYGSPGLKEAADWARDTLEGWSLQTAHLESFEATVPVWEVEYYSAELIAPRYMRLNAHPVAWTPPTAGVVIGTPIVVDVQSEDDFEEHRGKLAGRIVFNGSVEASERDDEPEPRRFSSERIAAYLGVMDPGKEHEYWEAQDSWQESKEKWQAIAQFFKDEQVAVLITPSYFDGGVVDVTSSELEDPERNAPSFVLARESFNMVARLVEKGHEPEIWIESKISIGPDAKGYNVIADIPGVDPEIGDELVMLGGHLDAWHAGSGATDNAAGCAVTMEAVRILAAIGVRPRRTIRIALWDGEEVGYDGSIDYVERHFANLETMEVKPDHDKFSAYFNIDSGTGKVRGVYLQGNERVRPIFADWLEPFHYLGADTLSALNDWSTDHIVFDAVGLPAFDFIHDPLDYDTLTHHTDQDFYDHLEEADLKQAAVVTASFVYHAAMADERLPREAMPKARSTDAETDGD